MTKIIEFPELALQKFHIFVASSDTCDLHGHDFLEFTYVTKGAMEHIIGGERSILSAGDYFIVDYGTEHAYRRVSQEPLEVVNLLFYPDFLEQMLAGRRGFEDVLNSYLLRFNYRTLRSSPTGKSIRDENGQLKAIVEEAVREYAQKQDGYMEYIRCLLLKLLIITVRKIGRAEQSANVSDVVRNLTEHIRLNYANPLPITHLARKYGYSVSYLSRKFSLEMGMGFLEYTQRVRVGQSCRLLESTDMPIGEIASAVGYDDQKFFNHVFRKVLGITPREFRKSVHARS